MFYAGKRAFTLIELLIVVAILAVLAAIAVPNLMEAQTSSKTSNVVAGMRAVRTAIESYMVDWGEYPPNRTDHDQVMHMDGMMRMAFVPTTLTSPIAYIEVIPLDVFKPKIMHDHVHSYMYLSPLNVSEMARQDYRARVEERDVATTPVPRYALFSAGPDQKYGAMMMLTGMETPPQYMMMYPPSRSPVQYDPTNGTLSTGDIVRFAD
jgi:prepilin-type N-terminal cleavage/methylation domain-containing protein